MHGVPSDLLRIYLQDHHAGAVGGLELAKRAADSNSGWAHGAEIAELRDQIAADKEALEAIMDHLDAGPSKIKDGLGWTAEKLGRLKPNDHLFSQSPLSRLIELEGLAIGVTAKAALWEALRGAEGDSIGGVDIAALAARADSQLSLLKTLRRAAALDAFVAADSPA